jgi:hypothetical protein
MPEAASEGREEAPLQWLVLRSSRYVGGVAHLRRTRDLSRGGATRRTVDITLLRDAALLDEPPSRRSVMATLRSTFRRCVDLSDNLCSDDHRRGGTL